jgi:hypothetical protein
MSRRLFPLVLLTLVIPTSFVHAKASTLAVDAGVLHSFRVDPPPLTQPADCAAQGDDACDAERPDAPDEAHDASSEIDGADEPPPPATEPSDVEQEASPATSHDADEGGRSTNDPSAEDRDQPSVGDENPSVVTSPADPAASDAGGQGSVPDPDDEAADAERAVEPRPVDDPPTDTR